MHAPLRRARPLDWDEGATRAALCVRPLVHPPAGKKQDIKITGASTLSKDDVDKMVKEAEKFAGEDKKRREAVDTKNQAESMVYQTEKQLKEFEGKVPEDVKVSRRRPVPARHFAREIEERRDPLPLSSVFCCVQTAVEAKVAALREAVAADDAAKMKSAMEALQQEALKLGQAVYAQGGQAAGQPGPGGAGPAGGAAPGGEKKPGDDNVIDAEFNDAGKK